MKTVLADEWDKEIEITHTQKRIHLQHITSEGVVVVLKPLATELLHAVEAHVREIKAEN